MIVWKDGRKISISYFYRIYFCVRLNSILSRKKIDLVKKKLKYLVFSSHPVHYIYIGPSMLYRKCWGLEYNNKLDNIILTSLSLINLHLFISLVYVA